MSTTFPPSTSQRGGERVRFFPRQLLGAEDLEAEQAYHRQRIRDHNRFLHGWGVVCGLDVQPGAAGGAPWDVRVCPGYALSPAGDEIAVHDPMTFDIASCVLTSDDPCAVARPCPPIGRQARKAGRVYLAVQHIECHSRPVRTAPMGCSCDDTACEPSRISDGYELCCLAELPSTHTGPSVNCADLFSPGNVLPCPANSSDSWVVLAAITLPDVDTEPITQIDLAQGRHQLYPTWALHDMLACLARP